MKPALALKLIVMVGLLIGVLFTIRSMNQHSMEKAFDALGLQAGGAGSPGLQAASRTLQPGEERFNLCRTRITGFEFEDGRKISESTAGVKTTWLAQDAGKTPREIGTLDIEKWLTQHCQVVVRAAPTKAGARPALGIVYVDGTRLIVKRLESDHFELDARAVTSADFAAALMDLQSLAQF